MSSLDITHEVHLAISESYQQFSLQGEEWASNVLGRREFASICPCSSMWQITPKSLMFITHRNIGSSRWQVQCHCAIYLWHIGRDNLSHQSVDLSQKQYFTCLQSTFLLFLFIIIIIMSIQLHLLICHLLSIEHNEFICEVQIIIISPTSFLWNNLSCTFALQKITFC